MIRPHLPNCCQGLNQETAAVLKTAPIFVLAVVGMIGKEVLCQVAMRKMQDQPLEPRRDSALGRRNKILTNPVDIGFGHRARYPWEIGAKRDGGRPDHFPAARIALGDMVVALPRAIGACFASGMTDLNARHRSRSLDSANHPRKGLGLGVIPQARTAWSNPPFRRNRGGFGDHKPRTATREAGEMDLVPFINDT